MAPSGRPACGARAPTSAVAATARPAAAPSARSCRARRSAVITTRDRGRSATTRRAPRWARGSRRRRACGSRRSMGARARSRRRRRARSAARPRSRPASAPRPRARSRAPDGRSLGSSGRRTRPCSRRGLAGSRSGATGPRSARAPARRAAPAVHLAPLERAPDGVAVAAGGVYGDQPARHEEGRLALGLEHREGRPGRDLVDGERRRPGRRGRSHDAGAPGLVPGADGLGHRAARELLVTRAGARGVVVARGDQAEAEAARLRRVVEVGDRERVLRRAPGPIVEGRVEAVTALAAVLPVLDRRARHGAMPRDAGPEIVGARRRDALLALRRRGVRAARADDLARLPAAGKVVPRRLGTVGRAARITVDGEPGAILLGVAVPRVHLEEALLLLVVHGAPELLVERAPGGGVEAPRRAVRDDERVEAPLRELLEEDVGRLGRLVAVGGQFARVDARRAERNGEELALEAPEVVVALAVREIEEREGGPLPEWRGLDERLAEHPGARTDRAARHAVLGRVAEDHVLVAVVRLRRLPDLRPLPAEERDQVGVLRIARERVALPDRLLRLRPVRGCDAFGVVVDAPEVEVRAVAREVAGVGGRMRALALHEGERAQEGVDGEGRVHVEVAEEDLPSGRLGDAEAAEGASLH